MERQYFVYILTNERRTVLYTGSTADLSERIFQHRTKVPGSFTERYNICKLVYADVFPTLAEAREAERRIKGWTRQKKITLIEFLNPRWEDLSLRG